MRFATIPIHVVGDVKKTKHYCNTMNNGINGMYKMSEANKESGLNNDHRPGYR